MRPTRTGALDAHRRRVWRVAARGRACNVEANRAALLSSKIEVVNRLPSYEQREGESKRATKREAARLQVARLPFYITRLTAGVLFCPRRASTSAAHRTSSADV